MPTEPRRPTTPAPEDWKFDPYTGEPIQPLANTRETGRLSGNMTPDLKKGGGFFVHLQFDNRTGGILMFSIFIVALIISTLLGTGLIGFLIVFACVFALVFGIMMVGVLHGRAVTLPPSRHDDDDQNVIDME